MNILGLLRVYVALALILPAAFAANVSVEPEAFQGNWMIPGIRDYGKGPATVNLAAGTYEMYIGAAGRISFIVDAVGNVTSLNSAAAQGVGNRLVFQTSPVAIDVADYAGNWVVSHVNDFGVGDRTLDLVRGIKYSFYVGWEGLFSFDLDGAGNVTLLNTAAATGGAGTITLNTMDLLVVPGEYTGLWLLSHVSDFTRGEGVVRVVPGLNYLFYVGFAGQFRFSIAGDGTVTSANAAAATGGAGTISINSVDATVEVGNYAGNWKFAHVQDYIMGSQTVKLIAGLRYDLFIASLGTVVVDVGAGGAITSSNTAAVAASAGNRLTFANAEIYIDPGQVTEWWRLDFVTDPIYGPARVVIVPNLRYELAIQSGDSGLLTIGTDGKISAADAEIGGLTFSFEEPLPPPPPEEEDVDSDSDGVVDGIDLCAATHVKPKQIAKKVDDEGCTRRQRVKQLLGEYRQRIKEIRERNKALHQQLKNSQGEEAAVEQIKEQIKSNKEEIKQQKQVLKEEKKAIQEQKKAARAIP